MRNQLALAFGAIALAATMISLSQPVERPGLTGWRCASGEIQWMEFSPDDRTAAFIVRRPADSNIERQLLIVDTNTWAVLIEDEGTWPTNVCFSAAGERVVVAWNSVFAIYDLKSGKRWCRIPTDWFHYMDGAVGFSPGGDQVVALRHRYQEILEERAWDLGTGERTTDFERPAIWHGWDLTRDGTTSTTRGWPTPRISRLDDPEFRTYCFYFPFHIFQIFTPDSRNLLSIHPDGMAIMWELRDTDNENAKIVKSEADTGLEAVDLLSLTSTSERIAYLDADGTIQFYPLFTRKPTARTAAERTDGSLARSR